MVEGSRELFEVPFIRASPSWPNCLPKVLPTDPSTLGDEFQLWIWGETQTFNLLQDPLFKITADGDCSHEIKRRLLLERKVMTNLDSILKSRDITMPTKVCLDKAMVFPVVMYGCKSWTIKKAECQIINAFDLWCWRRLLRVPWMQGGPTSPF